jgi:hypothetical protein
VRRYSYSRYTLPVFLDSPNSLQRTLNMKTGHSGTVLERHDATPSRVCLCCSTEYELSSTVFHEFFVLDSETTQVTIRLLLSHQCAAALLRLTLLLSPTASFLAVVVFCPITRTSVTPEPLRSSLTCSPIATNRVLDIPLDSLGSIRNPFAHHISHHVLLRPPWPFRIAN